MFLRRARVGSVVVLAALGGLCAASLAAQAPLVLGCEKLIDGLTDDAGPALLRIEGEHIVTLVRRPSTATRAEVTRGAVVRELPDATCLPGLIDAHSHPLIRSDDYQLEHLRASSARKALLGLAAVQANLRAGWTTLRIAGDADVGFAIPELARALREGHFVGPRIVGAAHYLSVTGGGGDLNQFSDEQRVIPDGVIADGPDALRAAVRREIKFGSDWIKILVTGAFMSQGDRPADVHMSREELDAVVEEAERRGVPVMAHAHAAEGIAMAVRAGVATIEHGTFLDDEGIELMLEHGTFLVPTIFIGDYYAALEADDSPQQKMIELSRKTQAAFVERIARAHGAGVRIGVGTDFGGYPAELNIGEIEAMLQIGMTPMEAIRAATRTNAEILGLEDEIGSLSVGMRADVLVVRGDPLADLSTLRNVQLVIKDGAVIDGP